MATLKASLQQQEFSTVVSTSELNKTSGTLIHSLVARGIVRDWEDGPLDDDLAVHWLRKRNSRSLVVELAKEHSLVTSLTSFLAVEKRHENETITDVPHILELLVQENVDILPYMEYEDFRMQEEKDEPNMDWEPVTSSSTEPSLMKRPSSNEELYMSYDSTLSKKIILHADTRPLGKIHWHKSSPAGSRSMARMSKRIPFLEEIWDAVPTSEDQLRQDTDRTRSRRPKSDITLKQRSEMLLKSQDAPFGAQSQAQPDQMAIQSIMSENVSAVKEGEYLPDELIMRFAPLETRQTQVSSIPLPTGYRSFVSEQSEAVPQRQTASFLIGSDLKPAERTSRAMLYKRPPPPPSVPQPFAATQYSRPPQLEVNLFGARSQVPLDSMASSLSQHSISAAVSYFPKMSTRTQRSMKKLPAPQQHSPESRSEEGPVTLALKMSERQSSSPVTTSQDKEFICDFGGSLSYAPTSENVWEGLISSDFSFAPQVSPTELFASQEAPTVLCRDAQFDLTARKKKKKSNRSRELSDSALDDGSEPCEKFRSEPCETFRSLHGGIERPIDSPKISMFPSEAISFVENVISWKGGGLPICSALFTEVKKILQQGTPSELSTSVSSTDRSQMEEVLESMFEGAKEKLVKLLEEHGLRSLGVVISEQILTLVFNLAHLGVLLLEVFLPKALDSQDAGDFDAVIGNVSRSLALDDDCVEILFEINEINAKYPLIYSNLELGKSWEDFLMRYLFTLITEHNEQL